MILDSRGEPTLEVTVGAGKFKGVFGVPSGASTGSSEALELRDGGKLFSGKGVSKAINHVNQVIFKKLKGMDVLDQQKIDETLIALDGTKNKSRLGANAILGVSGAVCKAAAEAKGIPLFKYVALLFKNKTPKLPRPMFNFINGGLHGDSNLNIQEFMLVPKAGTMAETVAIAAEIFQNLKKVLKLHRQDTDLGNEGGFSPDWESNEQPLKLLNEAVISAGLGKGKVEYALDVAANSFYNPADKRYNLSADRTSLSAERLVSLYSQWIEAYPIISIEDGLMEDDWEGWQAMQERIGNKVLLVGDDLFVTQKEKLRLGIGKGVANAVIIKPNQVGTITETLETVALARKSNYKIVASHRSGETNDDFIADFAVGIGADFLKAGSVARGERVAKWNRLMAIEEEIK